MELVQDVCDVEVLERAFELAEVLAKIHHHGVQRAFVPVVRHEVRRRLIHGTIPHLGLKHAHSEYGRYLQLDKTLRQSFCIIYAIDLRQRYARVRQALVQMCKASYPVRRAEGRRYGFRRRESRLELHPDFFFSRFRGLP